MLSLLSTIIASVRPKEYNDLTGSFFLKGLHHLLYTLAMTYNMLVMILYWTCLYPADIVKGAGNPRIVDFPFGHIWMCHLTPFLVGIVNASITKTVLKRDFNWLIVPFFLGLAIIELNLVPSGAPQGIVAVWYEGFKRDPTRYLLIIVLLCALTVFCYRLMVYLDEKHKNLEERQTLRERRSAGFGGRNS